MCSKIDFWKIPLDPAAHRYAKQGNYRRYAEANVKEKQHLVPPWFPLFLGFRIQYHCCLRSEMNFLIPLLHDIVEISRNEKFFVFPARELPDKKVAGKHEHLNNILILQTNDIH